MPTVKGRDVESHAKLHCEAMTIICCWLQSLASEGRSAELALPPGRLMCTGAVSRRGGKGTYSMCRGRACEARARH